MNGNELTEAAVGEPTLFRIEIAERECEWQTLHNDRIVESLSYLVCYIVLIID